MSHHPDIGPNIGHRPLQDFMDRMPFSSNRLTAALGGFLLVGALAACASSGDTQTTPSSGDAHPAVAENWPSVPAPMTTDGSPIPVDPELAQAANKTYEHTKTKTLGAFQRIFVAMQASDLSDDTTTDPNRATYSAGTSLYAPVTIDAVVAPDQQTLHITAAMETKPNGDFNANNDVIQVQAAVVLPLGSAILDTTQPLSFAELTSELKPSNTGLTLHSSYAAVREQELKLSFPDGEPPQIDYPLQPVEPQSIIIASDVTIYGDQVADGLAEASWAMKRALEHNKPVEVSG